VGLNDREGVRGAVTRNAADRAEFLKQANKRGLNPMPSYANFVMMDSPLATPEAIEHFKQRGIAIGRDFHYGQRVRISLGKPEEMAAFWRAWDEMKKA
jgi:histidinol-phosphate/aromatic aminotransferase/cobyric acid decarboxylase-like protein